MYKLFDVRFVSVLRFVLNEESHSREKIDTFCSKSLYISHNFIKTEDLLNMQVENGPKKCVCVHRRTRNDGKCERTRVNKTFNLFICCLIGMSGLSWRWT